MQQQGLGAPQRLHQHRLELRWRGAGAHQGQQQTATTELGAQPGQLLGPLGGGLLLQPAELGLQLLQPLQPAGHIGGTG